MNLSAVRGSICAMAPILCLPFAAAGAQMGGEIAEQEAHELNFSDADGKPMVGEKRYVLHFSKAELPPVDAFRSVTMYDAASFHVANKLNRFASGGRDALKYNTDGPLDIYFQPESPGNDKESNWLPSPVKGVLSVTMRLYAPHASVRTKGPGPGWPMGTTGD